MQQDYGALIKGPNGPDGFNQLGHCGSCTYVIESEFFTSSAHSKLTFSLVTRSDLTHEEWFKVSIVFSLTFALVTRRDLTH